MHVVPVALGPAPYDISVGDGALEALPAVLARACPAACYAIIADSAVATLYGERVRALATQVAPAHLFPFPAGEWNKSREQWQELTDALLAGGVGRDAAVIALGGGVAGDLAGFVAATFMRGIPVVQVPTTLLAMVDSSVGGKTGVDTPAGKNLVGAFHQPRAVVADIAVLATLAERHLRAGCAEILKHGAIADRAHFDRALALREALVRRVPGALEEIVAASVAIKATVVAEDEREGGKRAILNAGHTVAHALEAVSGYAALHGEAVGLGLVIEAALGEALGVTRPGTREALTAALEAMGLPRRLEEAAPGAVLDAMLRDKKNRRRSVRFAFLRQVGEAARSEAGEWTFEAPANLIADTVASFG